MGDRFTELIIRGKDIEGSFYEKETRPVAAKVCDVISVRPGLLGLGETGTLTVEGIDAKAMSRDCLLKGSRS